MQLTTLCYIERDDSYLMLHRIKKENDLNRDKWIGIGGRFEADESPEECLLREAREETGLELLSFRMRGIVTFLSEKWEGEYMFLYTADYPQAADAPLPDCDEGVLEWIPKSEIFQKNLWAGDKIFFRLLEEERPFFSLKLAYDAEDVLCGASLDGRNLTKEEIEEMTGEPL